MNGKQPHALRAAPFYIVGHLHGQGVSRSDAIASFADAAVQRKVLADSTRLSYVVSDSRDNIVVDAQGREL